MSYDAYAEVQLIVHRHFRIEADSLEDATAKAQALAQAWIPTHLARDAQFPAYSDPVIRVEVSVIKSEPPR